MEKDQLTYLVSGDQNYRFSLRREDSDFSANQNLLDHLIATLVKYGHSGHPEPYLAESWQAFESDHRWEFTIRSDLTCEDGTAITARSYVDNLLLQLKELSQSGKIMDFDLLKGWSAFIEGKASTIEGLQVSGNKVIFLFKHRPDDFLDTLRKVYFGYWCPSVSANRLVSSGSYKLDTFANGGTEVVLAKRKDWFSVTEQSPGTIRFSAGNIGPMHRGPTVLSVGLSGDRVAPAGFRKIQSTPSWLIALVIHAKPGSVFWNVDARKTFATRLRETLAPMRSQFEYLRYAEAFFPSETLSPESIEPHSGTMVQKGPPLKFRYSRDLAESDSKLIESAIRRALPMDQEVQFSKADRGQPGWLGKYLGAEDFDVRIQAVDVGGPVSNSAVKMMFCTKLGVSFPDHSGEICKLVDEYNSRDLVPDQVYSDRFNSSLRKSSIVIPLFHAGLFYLYSENIDPKSITPQLIVPRFDLLRLN